MKAKERAQLRISIGSELVCDMLILTADAKVVGDKDYCYHILPHGSNELRIFDLSLN